MCVETKYLRLFREARLGDQIDGWRVCWLGGWDKCRVVFVVMVERFQSVRKWRRVTAGDVQLGNPDVF